LLPPVGGDALAADVHEYPVERLGALPARARHRAAGDAPDHTLVVSELLVGERLVPQQHLVARLDETDGTTRNEQLRAQVRAGRQQRQQRLSRLHRLAGLYQAIGDKPGDRRFHQQLSTGVVLDLLAVQQGQLTSGVGFAGSTLGRETAQRFVHLRQVALERGLLPLQRLASSSEVEYGLFLLVDLQFAQVLLTAQRAITVQGVPCQCRLAHADRELVAQPPE